MKFSIRLKQLEAGCNGLLPVAKDPCYLAKKLIACGIPEKTKRNEALAKLGQYRVLWPKGFTPLSERLKKGSKR